MKIIEIFYKFFCIFALHYIHTIEAEPTSFPEDAVTYFCFPQQPKNSPNYEQTQPSYLQHEPNETKDIFSNCIVRNMSLPETGFFLLDSRSQVETLEGYESTPDVSEPLTSTLYTSEDNKMFYFMVIFIFCILVISVINITINYFTLTQCVSIKQPVNKWYQLFALNQAASLRYIFNTLRNENEMLYEQIYLLIKHLKNSDNKHIIVINRNAIENEAKYDYARFSGYMHLKTPIYEAPFDLKKGMIVEEG